MTERVGATGGIRDAAHQARYSLRYVLSGYPAVHVPLTRLRHPSRPDRLVSRDTELVIEGFGRSGNTFAVVAFELAQPRPVRIVHHTHAAAQVIRAARMGIPAILLVRDPVATAISHMMYRPVTARAALTAWIRYHTRLLPVRAGIVVAPFEVTTSDLGSVIREVNRRFGTSFREFHHTPDNVEAVFRRIEELNQERYGRLTETISRPTAERERRKALLKREVERPDLARHRVRAEAIYRRLLEPREGGPRSVAGR
jgi:hypothetical protein